MDSWTSLSIAYPKQCVIWATTHKKFIQSLSRPPPDPLLETMMVGDIHKVRGSKSTLQVQNQVLAVLQFGATDPWAWLAAGPWEKPTWEAQNRVDLWWI